MLFDFIYVIFGFITLCGLILMLYTLVKIKEMIEGIKKPSIVQRREKKKADKVSAKELDEINQLIKDIDEF